MRLISHFSDFYDSALAFEDGDDSVVYLRQPISFKFSKDTKYPPLVKELLDLFNNKGNSYLDRIGLWEWKFRQSTQWYRFTMENDDNRFYQYLFTIIFCGRVYPLIRIQTVDKKTDVSEDQHFYDFATYQKFLEKHALEFVNSRGRNLAENYFKVNITDRQHTFLIENKVTIVIIGKDEIVFNGKLSDYQFYKVFDPYTCYQELDTWLSGVLAYPQNIMIEVGNESKIEKHGFDSKYGFRTRPKVK